MSLPYREECWFLLIALPPNHFREVSCRYHTIIPKEIILYARLLEIYVRSVGCCILAYLEVLDLVDRVVLFGVGVMKF